MKKKTNTDHKNTLYSHWEICKTNHAPAREPEQSGGISP